MCKELPWLTFLKKLSNEIQTACTDNFEDGLVSWNIKQISSKSTGIEIQYTENGDSDFPKFHMFVAKKYFNLNMVRLYNIDTNESYVMQADPKLILAWLSF